MELSTQENQRGPSLRKPQEQHWAVMNHDQDQQSTSYSTNP